MPDLTEILKLKKPRLNEAADIQVINENMDIIDAAMSSSNDISIILNKENWSGSSYQIGAEQLQSDTSGTLTSACTTDEEYAALKAARISCNYVLTTSNLKITALGTVPEVDIHLKLTINDSGGFIIDLPTDGGDADTLGKKEPAYFASKADYLELLQRIEAAEENLNKKIDKNCSPQFFLPANGWDENNQQTLPCDKFTVGSTIIPAYIMPESNIDVCSKAGISIHSNTNTTITFSCSNVPDVDVVVGAMYQGESDVTYEIIDEIGEKVITWYTEEMLPDPSVVTFLNAEGATLEEQMSDKSSYKQTVTNVNGRIYEVTGMFFKGNNNIWYNNLDFNVTCNQELLRIDTVNGFDPSNEWQLSFSALLNGGNYGSNAMTNVAYFSDLGCGFKVSGDRTINLYFCYRDSTGTLKSVDTGINYYTYGGVYLHCAFLLSYKKDADNTWKYDVEIRYVRSNDDYDTIVTKNFEYKNIYVNQSTDSTKLLLGGLSNKKEAGSSTYYTYMVLDEIVLRNKIDENYKFPTKNNKNDGFEINIPTQVEHTKVINVMDNTILRYNADGTVDKYDVNGRMPKPYKDNSNTIFLLHGEELINSATTSGVCELMTSSDFYNITISDKSKLGSGSYYFDGTSSKSSHIKIDTSYFRYGGTDKRSFTIDFWANAEAPIKAATLISLNPYTSVSTTLIKLTLDANGYLTLLDAKRTSETPVKSTKQLIADTWHHISLIFDGSTLKAELLIDGETQGKLGLYSDGTSTIFNVGGLGCWRDHYNNSDDSGHYEFFKGYIDEFRATNKVETEFIEYEEVKGWVRL